MIPTSGISCSQCGTMHPPLQPGQKCPLAIASAKTKETTNGLKVDVYDITDTIVNIMLSQIDKKKIKDIKKLKGHIIINITKILEGYTE